VHIDLGLDNFLQLLVNGLINGSAFALLGVAFGIILGVTGRFHFAFAFTYALSAYIAAEVGLAWNLPFWLAMVLGAIAGLVLGVLMEFLVYRPLARRSGAYALLTIFVSSLGLAIMGENLLSIIFHSSASESISGVSITAIKVGSVDFTSLNVEMVLTSWVLILALAVVMSRTKFGRMVRAVRSNPDMSLVVGVSPGAIFLAVFAIGSLLGGVAGVFQAAQTAATPSMGFEPIFYAFTVAFLAGAARPPVVVGLVGLAVGIVQSLSGLFLTSQYAGLVVFAILFIYVAMRPLQLRSVLSRPAQLPAA
jgi:branched-subunit amino acid ABC-type transport system permease component